MLKWIATALIIIALWYLGRILWERVIQPYFREEVVNVRTSVQMD